MKKGTTTKSRGNAFEKQPGNDGGQQQNALESMQDLGEGLPTVTEVSS